MPQAMETDTGKGDDAVEVESMTAEERRRANKQIAKNAAPDKGRIKKKKDPRIAKVFPFISTFSFTWLS